MKYEYKYNALFRPGPNHDMNACIGRNGGPYDYSSFGEGFFQAGFRIIERIEDGAWTLDILIYPLIFNFRHGIELYIKHFIVISERLQNGSETMNKNHSLISNWDIAEKSLLRLQHSWFDQLELAIAKDIIRDVVQVDPNNQVFRYPEDRNGKVFFDDFSVINAEVLRDGMKLLFELFEKWESGLIALCGDHQKNLHSIVL